mmetsp:Transcript_39824/g.91517  ORF Transcript_39824/g.91517 Transcript_39824/m.91517 type:complete len:209 (-) Transcript_39824:158-784(-)
MCREADVEALLLGLPLDVKRMDGEVAHVLNLRPLLEDALRLVHPLGHDGLLALRLLRHAKLEVIGSLTLAAREDQSRALLRHVQAALELRVAFLVALREDDGVGVRVGLDGSHPLQEVHVRLGRLQGRNQSLGRGAMRVESTEEDVRDLILRLGNDEAMAGRLCVLPRLSLHLAFKLAGLQALALAWASDCLFFVLRGDVQLREELCG